MRTCGSLPPQVPAPCTLYPVPCTLHPEPAPCTLHPAPCTLHPVPCSRACLKFARPHVWLAAAADSGGSRARRGGVYFSSESHEPTPPSEATTDARLARKLWDVSEKLTGVAITL